MAQIKLPNYDFLNPLERKENQEHNDARNKKEQMKEQRVEDEHPSVPVIPADALK